MKFSRLIIYLLAFAAPALAERSPELSTKGLEPRVEFWKKIFTQYGKDDVVIHDRIHVNLIYDVASNGDVDRKMGAVRDALKEIRANLDSLDNLGPAAQQI